MNPLLFLGGFVVCTISAVFLCGYIECWRQNRRHKRQYRIIERAYSNSKTVYVIQYSRLRFKNLITEDIEIEWINLFKYSDRDKAMSSYDIIQNHVISEIIIKP